MTTWTTPEFTEIKMDAEIGPYQDGGDMPGEDPILRDDAAADDRHE
jgi:hypothetical protein